MTHHTKNTCYASTCSLLDFFLEVLMFYGFYVQVPLPWMPPEKK